MKNLILLFGILALTYCGSKSKRDSDNYSFENDPKLSDHQKSVLREKFDRDSKSFDEIESDYQKSKMAPFYLIKDVIIHAIKENKWDKASLYSKEYLDLAAKNKKDWNYGNAIFDSNIALGLVAFQKNKVSEAKNDLIKASKSPGSPQLNSFGPFSPSAKILILDILEKGDKKTVLEFIKNCRLFVNALPTKDLTPQRLKLNSVVATSNNKMLDRATAQIQNNQVPDFQTPEDIQK